MRLGILNSPIMTAPGMYRLEEIDLGRARDLVAEAARGGGIESAIRNPVAAAFLTELLGIEVPVSDVEFVHEVGQSALVFKPRVPRGRPPLDLQEMRQAGYSLYLSNRLE